MRDKKCVFFKQNSSDDSTDDNNEYSNDEFRQNLLRKSIQGPIKEAVEFFTEYFQNGGQLNHPQFGNLTTFANEIDKSWNEAKQGANLVAGLIRHQEARENEMEVCL